MFLDSPTCKSKLQPYSPLNPSSMYTKGALHPQGDWPREEAHTGSGGHLNKEFWSPELCGGGGGRGDVGSAWAPPLSSLERSVEAGGQK